MLPRLPPSVNVQVSHHWRLLVLDSDAQLGSISAHNKNIQKSADRLCTLKSKTVSSQQVTQSTQSTQWQLKSYTFERLARAESGAHTSCASNPRFRPCLRPARHFLRRADRFVHLRVLRTPSPAVMRTAIR